MKKVLFLLTTAICFFTITSCNDDESKSETTAADSTTADSSSVAIDYCASGDSSQIGYWQIDDSTALAMITNVGSNGKSDSIKYARGHIDTKIKDSFKINYVGLISARYRAADVERYRTKRCLQPADSSGMVAQYFTKIVKVKIKSKDSKDAATSYAYYDIVTICPPPDDCNKSVVK